MINFSPTQTYNFSYTFILSNSQGVLLNKAGRLSELYADDIMMKTIKSTFLLVHYSKHCQVLYTSFIKDQARNEICYSSVTKRLTGDALEAPVRAVRAAICSAGFCLVQPASPGVA